MGFGLRIGGGGSDMILVLGGWFQLDEYGGEMMILLGGPRGKE
jgi:hypothetical protein